MIPTLRPPQLEAVKSIIGELSYRPSTLAVMATGSGKTYVFAALARVWLRRGGKRVWITAPRGELLDQAKRTVRLWNPTLSDSEIGREQADERGHDGNRVILCSLQSLKPGRIEAVPDPDLIIVDEAHLHADQVRSLAERHPAAKRVGLTATPDRADAQALMPFPFESLPARQIYELKDGIKDGYLTPPTFKRVVLAELDALEDAPSNGDYADGTLSQIMRQPPVIAHTARAALDLRGERPTAFFCCDIAHAEALHSYLEPFGAELIHGQMGLSERREILDRFEVGKTRMLVSVMLLTYGIDIPPLSCVVLVRPTKSRPLYSQTIGRGLRLYPGKTECLVIDFVGNSQKLGLVTPEDLLYGGMSEDDFEDVMHGFVIKPDFEEGVDEQITITAAELPPMPAEGEYRVIEVDAQLSAIGVSTGFRHELDPPATYAQLRYLQKFGVDGYGLSLDQASNLIDELLERDRAGWATLKQARWMQKKGLNPMVKKEEASWALDRTKANNWRLPPDVRTKFLLRGTRAVTSR